MSVETTLAFRSSGEPRDRPQTFPIASVAPTKIIIIPTTCWRMILLLIYDFLRDQSIIYIYLSEHLDTLDNLSAISPQKEDVRLAKMSASDLPALKTNPKFIFFTDFDGTITLQDSMLMESQARCIVRFCHLEKDYHAHAQTTPFNTHAKIAQAMITWYETKDDMI